MVQGWPGVSQYHLAGLAANRQRCDLCLGERQNLFGLGGGCHFGTLVGEFDEVEVQSKPCQHACQYERRPVARHGLTNDAASATLGGRTG